MGHTFVNQTPTVTLAALGLLYRTVVLPQLVYRDAEANFAGKQGTTVNVRRPAMLKANDAGMDVNTRNVTGSTIKETSFPVALNKYPLDAVDLSDEDMTLNVDDFGSRILVPQLRAVVEFIEDTLANSMVANTLNANLGPDADVDLDDVAASNILARITTAGRVLNQNKAPRGNRVLVCGAEVEELIVGLQQLTDVSQSGDAQALRDATVGRLRGFTVVGSEALPSNQAIAMHPTAFALVTRAPSIPEGVSFGSSQSFNGFALRWIKDYDSNKLSDRSVVGTYMGVTAITDKRDPSDEDETASMLRAVRLTLA